MYKRLILTAFFSLFGFSAQAQTPPSGGGGGGGSISTCPANSVAYFQTTSDAISCIPTAISSILGTNGAGVPSFLGTIPSPVQDTITRLGTVVSAVWHATIVDVVYGGTGAASFTANGLVLGNGTGPLQVTAQGGARTVLTGTGAAPAYSSSPSLQVSLSTPLITGLSDGTSTPSILTLRGANGGGANVAGANTILGGGLSTGSVNGGAILLQTTPGGSPGSSLNTPVTHVTLGVDGYLRADPSTGFSGPIGLDATFTGNFSDVLTASLNIPSITAGHPVYAGLSGFFTGGTFSGDTNNTATYSGSFVAGHGLTTDAGHNIIDSGAAASSGTVASGTINQIGRYNATGSTISGASASTLDTMGVLTTSQVNSTFNGVIGGVAPASGTFTTVKTALPDGEFVYTCSSGSLCSNPNISTDGSTVVFAPSGDVTIEPGGGITMSSPYTQIVGSIAVINPDSLSIGSANDNAFISSVTAGIIMTGVSGVQWDINGVIRTTVDNVGSLGDTTHRLKNGFFAGALQIGTTDGTASSGEILRTKITASGTAPGSGTCKDEWVAGTASNSGKKIAYCDGSTTPTTLVDSVGNGGYIPTSFFNTAGAPSSGHTVTGTATLAFGAVTVNFLGAAAFSGTSSYICTANDTGASPLAVASQNQSSTAVRFTGTASDGINFICTGT